MPAPESIFLVLTTECDKQCPHCFNNLEPGRKTQQKMSLKDIVVFLKKMRLLGARHLYLTGGEPLLREDLTGIILEAHKMGMVTYLLSNGRSLDIEKTRKLEAAGLDVFVLSLCSLEHEDRKTVSMARKFDRTALSIIFVVTNTNYSLVPDISLMADALAAGLIFQPVYIPAGHDLHDSLDLSRLGPFDWSALYTDLRHWASNYGYMKYLDFFYDFYTGRKRRPVSCMMGRQALIVDADGEVYPCFHRRDLKCGNVLVEETGTILDNLSNHSKTVSGAACFGEHCISLHTGYSGA